jgi:hypothetical protein
LGAASAVQKIKSLPPLEIPSESNPNPCLVVVAPGLFLQRQTGPALQDFPGVLLELPTDNVNVVYLDLSHWISLTQASVGHSKGNPFVRVFEACGRMTNIWRFP